MVGTNIALVRSVALFKRQPWLFCFYVVIFDIIINEDEESIYPSCLEQRRNLLKICELVPV